jgi:hypothetical protein
MPLAAVNTATAARAFSCHAAVLAAAASAAAARADRPASRASAIVVKESEDEVGVCCGATALAGVGQKARALRGRSGCSSSSSASSSSDCLPAPLVPVLLSSTFMIGQALLGRRTGEVALKSRAAASGGVLRQAMASSGLAKSHETRRCAFGVTGFGAAPEISLASTNASASASSNDCRAGNAGRLLWAVITIADCVQRGRELGAEAGLRVTGASLGEPGGLAALARAAATLCVSEATLPREGRSAEGAEHSAASIASRLGRWACRGGAFRSNQ